MKAKCLQLFLMFILIYLTDATSVDRSLIKYNQSLEYVYLYEIDTFAKIRPTDSLRPSSLKFKSEIRLNRLNDFDYLLRFDRIQHDHSPSGSYAHIKRVLNSPISFRLIDGEVKQLKLDFNLKDEKVAQWIRTLYENLFTTLQLPISEDIEQDEEVALSSAENFDQCQTVYRVKIKRKNFYEVQSSKRMTNCVKPKNRFINKFLINSDQECVHFVRDNRLVEVDCQEKNRANVLDVVQVIKSKLQFLRVQSIEAVQGIENVPSNETTNQLNIDSTNFEPSKLSIDQTLDEDLVETSKQLLSEICDRLQNQIDPRITRVLLELGRNVRMLDYNQLVEVAEHSKQIECKDRQQFKDILHSVIFQQGSAPAIQYLLERVDEPIDQSFYSLLAFSQKPTEDAARLVIPKLADQLNKIDSSSYQPALGITAFLGNYCEESDCAQNEHIVRAQRMLIGRLGNECSNKRHQILLLKCIQNIGILDQTMTDQLLPCLHQKSTAVRLATLQLLDRETAANPRVISELKRLFGDQDEESELRINAFLILIKALNFEFDFELKNFLINRLQSERNPQILSFVSSYLKNQKNESLKLKELANLIESNGKTENVFLFSKNIHLSPEFLRNSPLDGELDMNLIRNNKHQLVNGNLRGKLAADERQTVEFGFAQTGLSNLVEKFIGEITKRSANLQGVLQELLNQFVSLKKDREGLETLMDRLVREQQAESNQNAPARFVSYLAVNRKTIFLVDFNNDQEDRRPFKSKRSVNLNRSILDQQYERAFVLIYLNIGKELSNPLSPIKFALTGVTVVGLRFSNTTLAPTFLNEIMASIEIGSKQEHQLKFQSIQELGPVFQYEIQPVDKNYVFNLYMVNATIPLARSTVFLGERSAQEKLISQTAGRSVCTASLTNLIGVELCLSESKSLDQPIQKLMLVEIYLKKTDLSFKSWQAIFTLEKSKDSDSQLHNVVILFDTPGSRLNRHFNSKIQLRRSSKKLSLNGSFSNQIQKYAANLNVDSSDVNNIKSELQLYSNDRLTAVARASQEIIHKESTSEYKPTLGIYLPPTFTKPTVNLGGLLIIDQANKNNLRFHLLNRANHHNYLNGSIRHVRPQDPKKEKYVAEIEFNLPSLLWAHLRSDQKYPNNQFLTGETKLIYRLPRYGLDDTIKLSNKFENTLENGLTHIHTFVDMRCTKQSNLNFDFKYILRYQPNTLLENDFKFKYLNIKELNLFQRYFFNRTKPNSRTKKESEWFNAENVLRVELQPQQLTYQSHVALVYRPASELFQYKLDFDLNKIHSQLQIDIAKFGFDYQQLSQKPLRTYLKSALRFKSQFDLSYKDELQEVGKNEFKGEAILKWSKNKFARVDYNYTARNEVVRSFYKVNTDFQMHHMPHPYTHQALFERQKTNFTVKSLFKIQENELWNFALFHEYQRQFNLSLESEYLRIDNRIELKPNVVGTLLIDGNKFLYFDHSTQFNYTNQSLFELSSQTTSKKSAPKTNIKLIDRLNEKLQNKLLANVSISRRSGQMKLNLQSYLLPSVKFGYNDIDQTKHGQLEMIDSDYQYRSTWQLFNDELDLQMKLLRRGSPIGNLGLMTGNGFNYCNLKGTFYDWSGNAKLRLENEGRKVVEVKLQKHALNGRLVVDHHTNISVAVTNGYIKSETIRNGVRKWDFDASIQGRDSSKVTLFVADLFQFNLLFNPFIKNKFADLEINDISGSTTEDRKYLTARFEYDPRSFHLNTNYFNENLTYHKTADQRSIQMDFENLKFFGKSSHLLVLHKNFTQYSLKQFDRQIADAADGANSTPAFKLAKQIDLKFVSKSEFYVNLDYVDLFSLKSDVDLNRNLVHLNAKKQPYQIEFKVQSINLLLLDYHNKQIQKQLKLLVELKSEYQLVNYVNRQLLEGYDHETRVCLFENYDLDARLETVGRYRFEMHYELWQKFDLIYKRPHKEVKVNLLKERSYMLQIIEQSEEYKLEFRQDGRKTVSLLAKSVEFIHESELIYGDPERVGQLKLASTHSVSTGTRMQKALNLTVLLSKTKESRLLADYYHHSLDLRIDLFTQRKIQSIYRNADSKLLSRTEFAYLGPQTYHLYSNVTETGTNRMPFQLALIGAKKKPTELSLVKDDWRLAGEFNLMKLAKNASVIRIRNDVQKLYGNITLGADRKSFLIAHYILKDSSENVKGQANLTVTWTMGDILNFHYIDESHVILTKLSWLGDRMQLNGQVNHTDYRHEVIGLLRYDPSKTVRVNLNKTYNSETTLKSDLIASLTRTSHLYVEQINFGHLNASVNLLTGQQQNVSLNYRNDDQSTVFQYAKLNRSIDSNLVMNLQRLHPLLLINSSFNLLDSQPMKSVFNLELLEPAYKTKVSSEASFDEDSIVFDLITDSPTELLPMIKANLTFSGLSNKYYLLNSNCLVNQHKLTSIYRHGEYLNLEYSDDRLDYYQAKFVRKSAADEPLSAESFVKRVVNGKATVLDFRLAKSKNDLNSAIGVEYLNRKTTFGLTKLEDQVAKKRTLIFETIFDSQQSKKKVYDLRLVRVNNNSLKKRTVTLKAPYLSRPLLVDFEKKANHLLLKWNLLENKPDNELRIDFKGLQLSEMYKLVKTIVSYNDREIVGLDLEKNPISELTRLNVNFFNSTVKLEDNHERLIFNFNDKDLTLKVDKEYLIQLESQFRMDKLNQKVNQKIVINYDVQKQAVSYQDYELESLRSLSTQLLVKPVPLASTYISIWNTKGEISNEIFLLQINATDLNKRKFTLKHNGIYLFSRQFVKKQKKIIGEFWSEVLLNTRNRKFAIESYVVGEVFTSFGRYGRELGGDLSQSFQPIIQDWPLVNNFIMSLNQNFLDGFLLRLGTFIEHLSVRCQQSYNTLLEELELVREYSAEMFSIIFESFEGEFVRLRKLAFNNYKLIRSFVERQINLLRSYVPENYWNLLANLWSILCSSDYWQSRFPVITQSLLSFYF